MDMGSLQFCGICFSQWFSSEEISGLFCSYWPITLDYNRWRYRENLTLIPFDTPRSLPIASVALQRAALAIIGLMHLIQIFGH